MKVCPRGESGVFRSVELFSMTQKQGDREIEFVITVKEYANPQDPAMPFTPCGRGNSLLKALSECMRAVRRFPYEGD